MTIKQAIERLNFMIQQHICYEEVVLEDDNEDAQEELHETEVELEALRMAVQALKSSPRWIPCSERLPEMHEENDYTGRYEESNLVLICDASELHPQVHVGRCVKIEDKVWWKTREWKVLDKVAAWMLLPETYSGEV